MISRTCMMLLLLAGGLSSVQAQGTSQRIRLAPRPDSNRERWYPQPITTRIGEVVAFDNAQLAVILNGEAAPTRFPAERVLDIHSDEVPQDQREALDAFEKGDYTEAMKGFIASISNKDATERPPVWRQQWISMMAAQAAWRSGRGEIALELIEQLDKRPLPPLVWALLPIDWVGTVKTQPIFEAAAKRARSESLAVKLVAASWLLGSTKYRGAAESAIVRLVNLKAPTISPLAAQLRWRTKTPVELRDEWPQWQSQIEALPMPLRSGPMLSLAVTTRTAGLADVARRQALILETAAPSWHPDLSGLTADGPRLSQ
ncbi:MAG: hypothetical protein AAFX06_22000 [Planctomycetota bacterium]